MDRLCSNGYGCRKVSDETYYPKPKEIICYHCQQAAEKAIKSVMMTLNPSESIPKKHNLSFLLSQIRHQTDIPEDLYDDADLLTPYGIAVRYPNELFIEEHHVLKALDSAENILNWARKNMENRKSTA